MSLLDDKIKQASEFMQLWDNYHRFYQACLNKNGATAEDERSFSQIRKLTIRGWQTLQQALAAEAVFGAEVKALTERILSVESLLSLSDSQLQKLNTDWDASYRAFNILLADMQQARAKQKRPGGLLDKLSRLAKI